MAKAFGVRVRSLDALVRSQVRAFRREPRKLDAALQVMKVDGTWSGSLKAKPMDNHGFRWTLDMSFLTCFSRYRTIWLKDLDTAGSSATEASQQS